MRYFIVFYAGSNLGWVPVQSNNYINANFEKEIIATRLNIAINTIVITNVLELNERDYLNFIAIP